MSSIEEIKAIIYGPKTSEEERRIREKAEKGELTEEETKILGIKPGRSVKAAEEAVKRKELDEFINKEKGDEN